MQFYRMFLQRAKFFFFLFLLYISFSPSKTLVVRLQPTPDDVYTKTIILPIQIPRLLQDPQTVPHNINRSFGFKKDGRLIVDLEIRRSLLSQTFSHSGYVSNNTKKDSKSQLLNDYQPSIPLLLNRLLSSYYYFQQNGHLVSTAQQQISKSFTSSIWIGLHAGIEALYVSLQALGGGIAHIVLRNSFTQHRLLSCSLCQSISSKPNPFGTRFDSAMRLFNSLFVRLPQVHNDLGLPEIMIDNELRESQRNPNESFNMTIKSFKVNQYSKDIDLVNDGNGSIVRKRQLNESIKEPDCYILLMTEDQWV